MSNDTKPLSFDLMGIQACQQNRHPLLFVDRILEAVPGKSARGIKCFSYNEWFFPAHFAGDPNVPGFIQIECMVQTFIMSFLCMPEYKGKKTNFISVDKVRFKRKIIPGDTLESVAILNSFRRGMAMGQCESFVDGELACSADFIVGIPDVLNSYIPKKPRSE
ncbi:3-hydroxyacyl-ACP dehydratase FabZ family protein [sulfur-oxidizing endosymbiont of Gigantopelta aegis]|uniref:3-hydroxyacyl-ACP dehydratase FabZ family protein n=1 Tax=sulfur-oxidizing endosymbiont of Gigantopelta aegis TaxID=2794934 RepID=UPI0018DC95DD|nr:3-hydroxyacyl-ACP dehydratase FabZ family protein [sulfur-oxidizing endosymbiont of Gigantopelta aegis]